MSDTAPNNAATKSPHPLDNIPVIAIDIPIMYEDDGEDEIIFIGTPVMFEDKGQQEVGDSAQHITALEVLHCGIEAHLKDKPAYAVFADLNLYYHPINRRAYASPDVMVVEPFQHLPMEISSYRIGEQGPAPVLVVEVLSARSHLQKDLTLKPEVYSNSGVAEYLLVDPSGKLLAQRLSIRRRQSDGSWLDSQDGDGGVTSALGFRVMFEDDGELRVIDAKSGRRYVRPREAEKTIKKLEAEIARLKSLLPPEHRG